MSFNMFTEPELRYIYSYGQDMIPKTNKKINLFDNHLKAIFHQMTVTV